MTFIQKPSLLFLLGLVLSTIYIPGIIGASISTGWFVLLLIAPFCLYNLQFNCGLLFIAYAILSLAWTENLNIAFFFLLQLIALACIFQLGKEITDLKPIFKGLSIGLVISCIVAFFQYNGYNQIFSINNLVAGLFINPNIYGEVSVIILICLISVKLFWWIPVTLPGIYFAHSRTAMVALGVGLFIYLFKKNKLYGLISLIIVSILSFYFYRMNFVISSITERFDLWADTIRGFSLIGNGVGSFEIMYPNYAVNIDTSLSRPRNAHNDLLQLIFEFGLGTLFLVPFFWKALKFKNDKTIILYTIGIGSLFTFPFHVPMLAFITCLVAGHLSRSDDTISDIGDNRRSILSKSR